MATQYQRVLNEIGTLYLYKVKIIKPEVERRHDEQNDHAPAICK